MFIRYGKLAGRGSHRAAPAAGSGAAGTRARSAIKNLDPVRQYLSISSTNRPNSLPYLRQAWPITKPGEDVILHPRHLHISYDKRMNRWLANLQVVNGQTYFKSDYKWLYGVNTALSIDTVEGYMRRAAKVDDKVFIR